VDRLGSTEMPGLLEVLAGFDEVAGALLEEGTTTGLVDVTGTLLVVVAGTLLLDGITLGLVDEGRGLVVDGRGGVLDVDPGALLELLMTVGLLELGCGCDDVPFA
jgi:hypothetical protein